MRLAGHGQYKQHGGYREVLYKRDYYTHVSLESAGVLKLPANATFVSERQLQLKRQDCKAAQGPA
jgi:hypothetical protein